MSVEGPLGSGNQPFKHPFDSIKTSVSGKTSHRTVKEIEATEGYLSSDLHGLIDQVSRTFSPRTAEIIRTMGVFRGKRASNLSESDLEMVVSLANQIQHLSSQGSSSAELDNWAHKQLKHFDSVSSLDSGVGRSISSGSDSEENDASDSTSSQASSPRSQPGSLASWGEADEMVTRRYDELSSHPVIQQIEAQVRDPAVVFHILRSRQAEPLVQKLLDNETLSAAEHSALLVQAGHLDAMLKKGMSGSFSSAEAFMPFSSEVDLASPKMTSEVLMTLGAQAKESVTERHDRYNTLQEEGENAKSFLVSKNLQLDSSTKDQHLNHPLRSKHTDQQDFIAFRARAMATPQFFQKFDITDFASPEQMQKVLDFITQQLSNSEIEQKDVSAALVDMQKQLTAWETSHDKKDLAALCKQIRTLAKATHDPQLSETLVLMADHLADKVMTQVRADFEASVREQLKELEKPGSSRVLTVSVGLGVGLTAYGVEAVSFDFGIKYSFAVKGGDDTKIREVHIVDCSGTTSIGDDKIASGAVTLDMKNAKGKVFKNLDDFVSYHANDLVPILVGKLRNSTGNIRGTMRARRQIARRNRAVADADLLTLRLQEYGILQPSQKVHTEMFRKPGYSEFRQVAGAISGGVSALWGTLEASLTMTNTVTRFKTRYELLKTLRENPDQFMTPKEKFITCWTPVSKTQQNEIMCNLWDSQQTPQPMIATKSIDDIPEIERSILKGQLQSDPQYKQNSAGEIQKRLSGSEAIYWITARQDECRSDKTPKARKLEIREYCKQAILDQYSERDLYFFTLNARDGYIGVEPGRKQQLKQAEKSFRATCGASNPAEFIEAHTCTYYGLWKTYMMTFGDNESPAVDDSLFFKPLEQFIEPTLTRPQVNLGSDKRIQKHLQVPAKATSTEKSVEFEVSVSIPQTGISGSIAASYANAKNSTNPDNDGENLTLSFTVGAGGHLGKAIHAAGSMLAKKKDDYKALAGIPLELLLSPLEMLDFDMSAESDVTLELSFGRRDPDIERADDEEHDWHLEYARVTGTKSMGAKTPNVGIPTGPVGELKVNFGAKVSGTDHWYERPGNNTTGYIQTRYNGWKSGGKVGGQDCYWQTWVNQNKKCLSELLINMGRQTRNANEEIRETFKDIETHIPGFESKLSFQEWLEFRQDFTNRLGLFAACQQLESLVRKIPVKETDMRKFYKQLVKDVPTMPALPTEDEFVQLREKIKKGETKELEQALGINRSEQKLDFEADMLPLFQQYLDLQHQAHKRIARNRYKPSLRRMKAVN